MYQMIRYIRNILCQKYVVWKGIVTLGVSQEKKGIKKAGAHLPAHKKRTPGNPCRYGVLFCDDLQVNIT